MIVILFLVTLWISKKKKEARNLIANDNENILGDPNRCRSTLYAKKQKYMPPSIGDLSDVNENELFSLLMKTILIQILFFIQIMINQYLVQSSNERKPHSIRSMYLQMIFFFTVPGEIDYQELRIRFYHSIHKIYNSVLWTFMKSKREIEYVDVFRIQKSKIISYYTTNAMRIKE